MLERAPNPSSALPVAVPLTTPDHTFRSGNACTSLVAYCAAAESLLVGGAIDDGGEAVATRRA
jgi:hypothetical protein